MKPIMMRCILLMKNGYAKESASAVRARAFENTPFNVLYSYMKAANTASEATAKSIGMLQSDAYMDAEQEVTPVYMLERESYNHERRIL